MLHMHKYGALLIIVDGVSDVGQADQRGQTPLQLANLPTLDFLTARGRCGLIDPVYPGLSCGSDTAHLSIFGYDPIRYYRGRGAFETVGAGISMSPGDIAFKCNFAFMEDASNGIVRRRCADTNFDEDGAILCKSLDRIELPSFPDITIRVKHAGQHRLVVKMSGSNISDQITNTDPLVNNKNLLRSVPVDSSPEARRTASIVNELSDEFRASLRSHPVITRRKLLGEHEANVVLLRGASEQISLSSFELQNKLRAFMIAPTKIISGVGQTAGIEIVPVPLATGDYATCLESKATKCIETFCTRDPDTDNYSYDIGIVHIKAVDEAGHDRDVEKKIFWLEKVDGMVGKLLELLASMDRKYVVLVVTGDHSTVTMHGDHSCHPVPIIFADASCAACTPDSSASLIEADSSATFDEINIGTNGSLGRFPAGEILQIVRAMLESNEAQENLYSAN